MLFRFARAAAGNDNIVDVLHWTVLYFIVLCCVVLCCIVLYCIVLYCIVLCCSGLQGQQQQAMTTSSSSSSLTASSQTCHRPLKPLSMWVPPLWPSCMVSLRTTDRGLQLYQWLKNLSSCGFPPSCLASYDQCWEWLAQCQYAFTGWGGKVWSATTVLLESGW